METENQRALYLIHTFSPSPLSRSTFLIAYYLGNRIFALQPRYCPETVKESLKELPSHRDAQRIRCSRPEQDCSAQWQGKIPFLPLASVKLTQLSDKVRPGGVPVDLSPQCRRIWLRHDQKPVTVRAFSALCGRATARLWSLFEPYPPLLADVYETPGWA